ncbi:HET-domain-containing protein, partial [Trametes versicolor FP-101664 SS1]|uniref:HET-domain-containing protein n=1 Tax=Trametes versicolor (strain FP-101664) TaxID=717944 RepID=UPI0004622A61
HSFAVNPAAPYIVAHDPITDVGSAHALSLAKVLIDKCVHEHERCRLISPPFDVRLPTRLVDCTDPAFPRLVSTEGEHGQYLALSYVWGGAQPHKTTGSNVSIYSAGIDPSLLLQTIRDAIYVTHTLGFRYLWVDSLCIIQDSDEDKLHEIGRMHLIYRHAYLTIIAASAERASDGFLQHRPALLSPGLTLPLTFPSCRLMPGDKCSRSKQPMARGEVHLSEIHWLMRRRVGEPVDRRGWCLQELLMSSRALIFTSTTLQFRCQDTTLNVGNSLHRKDCDIRLPDIVLHPAPLPLQPRSMEWRHIRTGWNRIVQEYSSRTLGEASDKLVAFGALAEAFHRVLRCNYLAGLWSDTLLEEILWRAADLERDDRYVADRPAEYRAPSWSWAAFDGAVFSPSPWSGWAKYEEPLAEVIHCGIILKDPALPFGQVIGGSLVLRARLIPCKLGKPNPIHWSIANEVSIMLPRPPREQHPVGASLRFTVEEDSAIAVNTKLSATAYIDYLSDLFRLERGSAWLIPCWVWPDITLHNVEGLVVALENTDSGSETENRYVYRRIGYFKSSGPGGHHHWDELRRYALEESEVEIV